MPWLGGTTVTGIGDAGTAAGVTSGRGRAGVVLAVGGVVFPRCSGWSVCRICGWSLGGLRGRDLLPNLSHAANRPAHRT